MPFTQHTYPRLLPAWPRIFSAVWMTPVQLGSDSGSTLLATWIELPDQSARNSFRGPIHTPGRAVSAKGVLYIWKNLCTVNCKLLHFYSRYRWSTWFFICETLSKAPFTLRYCLRLRYTLGYCKITLLLVPRRISWRSRREPMGDNRET